MLSDLSHLLPNFSVNMIVRGRYAGVFVILGFRMIAGQWCADLKEVNPANLTETAPGGITLQLDCIRHYQQAA